MFAGISSRYDLLNRLLSLGVDRSWRRRTVSALLGSFPGGGARAATSLTALDICCGTADLALDLARGGFRVTGVDFCHEMLVLGRSKCGRADGLGPRLAEADALKLPFRDGTFAAATVAFGVRNLQDLDGGLAEIRRVLVPGGSLGVLEFGRPGGPLTASLYWIYLNGYVPVAGRVLSGDRSAYAYLASTIQAFPDQKTFPRRLAGAGFTGVRVEELTGGIANLYLATKPRR
jgi:demethylmenaquinone methyltransferase/2-methoxy-6-polyprenyl-1,4-benzoquinol methylase